MSKIICTFVAIFKGGLQRDGFEACERQAEERGTHRKIRIVQTAALIRKKEQSWHGEKGGERGEKEGSR